MTQFEYFVGFIGNNYQGHQKQDFLNEWGADGWEFTGHSEKAMDGAGRNYYMKRVKPVDVDQKAETFNEWRIQQSMGDALSATLDTYREIYESTKALLEQNNKPEKTDDPRPCQGGNANICVGEGCYNESCLKPRTESIGNKASSPCPKCGERMLIFYYYRNPKTGNHMHTYYVCTSWPSSGRRCDWGGWVVSPNGE